MLSVFQYFNLRLLPAQALQIAARGLPGGGAGGSGCLRRLVAIAQQFLVTRKFVSFAGLRFVCFFAGGLPVLFPSCVALLVVRPFYGPSTTYAAAICFRSLVCCGSRRVGVWHPTRFAIVAFHVYRLCFVPVSTPRVFFCLFSAV